MPTPYSHLTQVLLNYFDPTDVRVRTYPYTIDAQLFNVAANAMEDLDLRYSREVAARFTQTTPISIDNQGIYFGARLPANFVVPDEGSNPPLNKVEGLRNGQWITLPVYDDRLPAPARITVDPARSAVPFSSPILFDWTSDGSVMFQPALSQATLPIPSSLTFWMEGAEVPGTIEILVTGVAYPTSAWQKNRKTTSETIRYTSEEGAQATRTVWSSVSSVVLRGVPAGVRVACWHFPFTLPAVSDVQRPYTSPRYRDQRFNRYWSLKGAWLDESFHGGPGVGLSTLTRYATPANLLDLSIDANAYTMLACSATTLHVLDRRAMMPGSLDVTAISSDPICSVNVVYDEIQPSTSARYVRIIPLAHAANAIVNSFRYVVVDPDNQAFCVDAAGTLFTYSGGAAWSGGDPTEVSIPLTKTGTYVVTLQVLDTAGNVSSDSFPYLNAAITELAALDLTIVVPRARGVARDSLEQVWIWTGTMAIPVQLHHDAYIYDSSSRTVYVTDLFDQVRVS